MENWIFFLFFGAIAVYMLFGIVRHRGFKAAMFGARIDETVGQITASGRGFVTQKVSVHVLGAKDTFEHKVGLELSQSAVLAWSMNPVTLSIDEARQLIDLLNQAVRERAEVKQ